MPAKTVSIVISAYNEEDNVALLHEALQENLSKTQDVVFEYIFVNDGSTDQTLAKVKSLMATDPQVKLLDLSRNFGHEIAMTAGMDFAIGDAVIFMDADLQHPPSLLPEIIEAWQSGNEIVMTRRVDNQGQSGGHKMAGKLFYKVLNFLSDVEIPANAPDFRLIDRKYIDVIKQMEEKDRLFRGLLSWLGGNRKTVIDFVAEERQHGESKYNLVQLFRLARDSIIAFSIRPLRLALYLGIVAAVISLFIALYHIVEHFVLDRPTTGFATLLSTMTFIGSVQLVVLGIIGEYIGKIHMEVKKRPLYMADFHNNKDRKS